MGARGLLGGVLVVVGLASSVAGVVGLVSGGDDDAVAAPGATGASPESPTGGTESSSPTASPTAEPTDGPSPSPSDAEPTEEPEAESPEEFFASFGQALREGDTRFLFSRLHPFVLERYAPASCRAALASLDVPGYEVEVLDVEGEGAFGYETDGLDRRVPGATTVRIRSTQDGDTFVETDAHVVLDGERFLWFTDCGTPRAGAA